ncbi:ABC transporter substrate-binding protein [Nocardioides limicola]|uniref:ABC transporter substrate-binding protein n=1 Tax=Nocardioides limicola TaxID=2803368 RepID=UPI00193C6A86|nr:spermidine/putrescine ABC transporter substrate-binding protein [Nocardioides sp. DJM-14]
MPTDPALRNEVARLARQAGAAGVSRRRFLGGAGLAALAVAAPGLVGCGTQGARQTADSCVSEDLSATERTLHFSNWPLYIDEEEIRRGGQRVTVFPTLERFQAESGITVDYVADVNSNAEFFGVVRNQLADCQPTGRDLFVLTDYMARRMVELGWLQALDMSRMPNVEANLVDSLRSPSWDADRTYSVPWQTGLTGIAYNAKLTGEVSSFEELLTRADLKGKVSLLSEMQDTMIFMLLMTGADPENFNDDEFETALERLKEVTASGQIRRFTGNEYAQDLSKGNIVACEAWSGDVIQLQFDNPDIKFVAPTEGLSLWSDNLLVPNRATHKSNAEDLINFYYQPDVAAELAAWVNYICPVKGAQEAMLEIDPELAENELIFPSDELLANSHGFMSMDQATERRYQQLFSEVVGG